MTFWTTPKNPIETQIAEYVAEYTTQREWTQWPNNTDAEKELEYSIVYICVTAIQKSFKRFFYYANIKRAPVGFRTAICLMKNICTIGTLWDEYFTLYVGRGFHFLNRVLKEPSQPPLYL